jgi:hypothetical protein
MLPAGGSGWLLPLILCWITAIPHGFALSFKVCQEEMSQATGQYLLLTDDMEGGDYDEIC